MLNFAHVGQATGSAQSTEVAGAPNSHKRSKDSNFADFVKAQKGQETETSRPEGSTDVSAAPTNEAADEGQTGSTRAAQHPDSEKKPGKPGVTPEVEAGREPPLKTERTSLSAEGEENLEASRLVAANVQEQETSEPGMLGSTADSEMNDAAGSPTDVNLLQDSGVSTGGQTNVPPVSADASKSGASSTAAVSAATKAVSDGPGVAVPPTKGGTQEAAKTQPGQSIAGTDVKSTQAVPAAAGADQTVKQTLQLEVGKDGVLKKFSPNGKVGGEIATSQLGSGRLEKTSEQLLQMEVGKDGVLKKFSPNGKADGEIVTSQLGSGRLEKTAEQLLQMEVGKSGVLKKFETSAVDNTGGVKSGVTPGDLGEGNLSRSALVQDRGVSATGEGKPQLTADGRQQQTMLTAQQANALQFANVQNEAVVPGSGRVSGDAVAETMTLQTGGPSQPAQHTVAASPAAILPEDKTSRTQSKDVRSSLEGDSVTRAAEITDPRLRARSTFAIQQSASVGLWNQVPLQAAVQQQGLGQVIGATAQGIDRLQDGSFIAAELPGLSQLLTEAVFQPGTVHRPETPRHIASQLAEAMVAKGERNVDVALNPEELGRVKMRVSTLEGGITVTIQTERPETGDLMRRHINELAQEFKKMGFEDISFQFSGGDTAGGNSDRGSADGGGAGTLASERQDDLAAGQIAEGQVQHLNLGNSGVDMRI